MKRAQKNFERDPRKIFFLRAKPYRLVKAKNHELQSSWFNKDMIQRGNALAVRGTFGEDVIKIADWTVVLVVI